MSEVKTDDLLRMMLKLKLKVAKALGKAEMPFEGYFSFMVMKS